MLKFYRLLFGLSLLLLINVGIVQVGMVSAQSQPQYPNLEVIVMIDESGSMYDFPDRSGTDPDFWRSESMELLLNTLGANMTPAQMRLAVIPFSSSHQTEVLLDSFIDPTNSAERPALIEIERVRVACHAVEEGRIPA